MKRVIFVLCLALLMVSIANAGERPIFLKSVRAIGMGSAFNAFCDDSATLIYNPGGLSFMSNLTVSADIVTIGVLGDSINLFTNEEIKNHLSGELDWEDLSQEAKSIMLKGPTLGGNGGLLNVTAIIPTDSLLGSIGVGYYRTAGLDGTYDPGIFIPNIDMWAAHDNLLVAGASQKLNKYFDLSGTISAGMSVTYIDREKIEGFFSIVNVGSDTFKNFSKKGTGTGANLGFVYQPGERKNLTFAVVFPDVGGTTMNWNDGTSSIIYGRMNLGVAWRPEKKKVLLTADLNGFGSGGDIFNKIHLGAEYKLPLITLRMGFNKGWFTYGFKLLGCLEYAYHQEELGSFAGAEKEAWQYGNFNITLTF